MFKKIFTWFKNTQQRPFSEPSGLPNKKQIDWREPELLDVPGIEWTDPDPQGTAGLDWEDPDLQAAVEQGQVDTLMAWARTARDPEVLIEWKGLFETYTGPLLCWAAEKGELELVQLLLERGSDPNRQDELDQTALMHAAFENHGPVITCLLEHGARIETARESALAMACRQGHMGLVLLLLERGARIDGYWGQEALQMAIVGNQLELVQLLLNRGVSVVSPPEARQTLLRLAAYISRENLPIIQCLMAAGAEVNGRDTHALTPLISAAGHGYLEAVALFLKAGADLHLRDKYGETALFQAAKEGHADVVALLLDHGAAIEDTDHEGCSLLEVAARNCALGVVRLLLERGAHFEPQAATFALSSAVHKNHRELVSLLLAHGADLNGLSRYGEIAVNTALIQQVWTHSDIYLFLLDQGAEVNAQDKYGDSPLHQACKTEDPALRLEWVGELLKRGAKINLPNNRGETPLHVLAESDALSLVEDLLKSGAEVNAQTNSSLVTPLLQAIWKGRLETVQLLVEHGADLNLADKEGKTPLIQAASLQKPEIFLYLLECGANWRLKDQHGQTALHEAADRGCAVRVRALLEKGADVNQLSSFKMSPLLNAASNSAFANMRLLLEYGADPTVRRYDQRSALELMHGRDGEDLALVQYLLDQKLKLRARDSYGESALHRAAYAGQARTVALLLQNGADALLQTKDKDGWTPIMMAAAWGGNVACLQLLQKRGANIQALTKQGENLLMFAADRGHTRMTKYLLKQGLDPNHVSANGKTPLLKAMGQDSREIVRALIAGGAHVDFFSPQLGKTALMLAVTEDLLEKARLLVRLGADPHFRATENSLNALDFVSWSGYSPDAFSFFPPSEGGNGDG